MISAIQQFAGYRPTMGDLIVFGVTWWFLKGVTAGMEKALAKRRVPIRQRED